MEPITPPETPPIAAPIPVPAGPPDAEPISGRIFAKSVRQHNTDDALSTIFSGRDVGTQRHSTRAAVRP
jgi:hypothetical protein